MRQDAPSPWLKAIALGVLTLGACPRCVFAQRAPAWDTTIHGIVRSEAGTPVPGANVFLLETLDGTLTDSAGRFAFHTRLRGPATLAARRLGYTLTRRPITVPDSQAIALTLERAPAVLPAITVEAGAYTVGDVHDAALSPGHERGETLTPLEVVTTPGTTADVNRAIQTLPGVQNVDDGTGLFVRGGDYTETRALLDGAPMLNPVQLETPSGTFVGTVDPFLLDGIYFSSGGFGARYGNALSGIAALSTQGRPVRSGLTLSAGLAALSASGAAALPHGVGVRVAGNRLDTGPMFRLNGSTRTFDPAPAGHDLSGSASWDYRPTGDVTLFAIDQTNRLGVGVADASFSGTYTEHDQHDLIVGTWHDQFGTFAPSVSVSTSRLDRGEGFGAFQLRTALRLSHAKVELGWRQSARVLLRAGGEIERLTSTFDGTIPTRADDDAPGAPTLRLATRNTGDRAGMFIESDWRVLPRVRLVTGARSDQSTLTRQRTIDPRISAAIALRPHATLTLAWGVYHQIPDPLLFDPALGGGPLPSMRATHRIIGLQVGTTKDMARVELYDKRYRDLAQQTRDNRTVGGGTGWARGVDVFLKGDGPFGVSGRASYSYVSAHRTDPTTSLLARAPFDISHSAIATLSRTFHGGLHVAAAYRLASGRPFTPIRTAMLDDSTRDFVPEYGAPMSERLPTQRRLDLSASLYRALWPEWQGVIYVSVTNLLDHANVQDYRYSQDYRMRSPIGSVFNRSVYFGVSLLHNQ